MADFMTEPLSTYIEQAASDAPTPGGGSVAALAGALGSCMASMAGNFTVGKKKYAEVSDEVQGILDKLAPKRDELLACMQEDAVAFAAIGAAYGMPKATDEEKNARKNAIQSALDGAMEVPLRVIRAAVQCLEPLPRLAEIGNPNLVSDTGVAAILLEAAVRAAYLNVLINLTSLKDESRVAQAQAELDVLMPRAAKLRESTLMLVEKTIRK